MNSSHYNLIPKPVLEINSLEGIVNTFSNAFELNCGFHLLSNFFSRNPYSQLKCTHNQTRISNLGNQMTNGSRAGSARNHCFLLSKRFLNFG